MAACARRYTRCSVSKFCFSFIFTFTTAYVAFWTLLFIGDVIENDRWYYHEAPCKTPKEVIGDMIELTARTHHVLKVVNLPHFLCYGTLWGALRNNHFLAWENNVDICILEHDLLYQVDEHLLEKTFRKHEVDFSYNAGYGMYQLKYGSAEGELVIFSIVDDVAYRIGWHRRMFPFTYRKYHTFPARLVGSPFQTITFHGMDIPVPHEDIELLKYLYPDDWWKIVKPVGCEQTTSLPKP